MGESAIRVGGAAGLYRNTADFNSPAWSEVTNVRDVTPSGGWDFVGAPNRESPLRPYAKTELDKPVQVIMRADITNSEYQVWVEAAQGRKTTLDLLVLNGKRTETGAQGLRGPFLLSITDEAQPIDGAIYTTFELRPTADTDGNLVLFAEVTGGGTTAFYLPTWV